MSMAGDVDVDVVGYGPWPFISGRNTDFWKIQVVRNDVGARRISRPWIDVRAGTMLEGARPPRCFQGLFFEDRPTSFRRQHDFAGSRRRESSRFLGLSGSRHKYGKR